MPRPTPDPSPIEKNLPSTSAEPPYGPSAEEANDLSAWLAGKVHFYNDSAPRRGRTLLEFELPSDLGLKYACILRLLETLRTQCKNPLAQSTELCLDEAITNAIVWGNGQDRKKKVKIIAWEEDGRWGLNVTDQGNGFGRDALPDYDSEEFLWMERGRGIFTLAHYVSELSFFDGGRTLVAKS